MMTFVENYKGLTITQDEDGYSALNGQTYAADACESVADARAEIDDYWSSDEHGPLNGFFA